MEILGVLLYIGLFLSIVIMTISILSLIKKYKSTNEKNRIKLLGENYGYKLHEKRDYSFRLERKRKGSSRLSHKLKEADKKRAIEILNILKYESLDPNKILKLNSELDKLSDKINLCTRQKL